MGEEADGAVMGLVGIAGAAGRLVDSGRDGRRWLDQTLQMPKQPDGLAPSAPLEGIEPQIIGPSDVEDLNSGGSSSERYRGFRAGPEGGRLCKRCSTCGFGRRSGGRSKGSCSGRRRLGDGRRDSLARRGRGLAAAGLIGAAWAIEGGLTAARIATNPGKAALWNRH